MDLETGWGGGGVCGGGGGGVGGGGGGVSFCFFFNDTATTEIYTLSLHDALPISRTRRIGRRSSSGHVLAQLAERFDLLQKSHTEFLSMQQNN